MPPLTAELLGTAAVIIGLLIIAVVVDPKARATRKANRIRRHAEQGCEPCTLALSRSTRSPRPATGKGARR